MMNPKLQQLLDSIKQSAQLTDEEKAALAKTVGDVDKEMEITSFKLDRTEKVKRTTAILLEETIEELEQKRKAVEAQNKELEIETALEKVRTIAMGMKEPADMLEVCKTISLQLQSLGVKEIRNVQTAIFYESKGTYMNYEYYAKHDKTFITETLYTDHEIPKAFAAKMLKGKGEVYISLIEDEKKVKEWLAYQKNTNVFIDTFLETASSLNYYWFSLGPVALGISTYVALNDDELNLFRRFLNVFELAYRRYLDIEKAEAQAREAQIEVALERIRARALAMHNSDELLEVARVLREQMDLLGQPELETSAVHLYEENPENIYSWRAFRLGTDTKSEIKFGYMAIPKNSCSIVKEMVSSFYSDLKEYTIEVSGAPQKEWYKILFKIAPEVFQAMQKAKSEKEKRYYHFSKFSGGALLMVSSRLPSAESIYLQRRSAEVFDLAYRRFIDLKKAEAQAKEARIETALERVRAVAMAMKKSEELVAVSEVMYNELVSLGFTNIRNAQIAIENEEKQSFKTYVHSDTEKQTIKEAPYSSSPLLLKAKQQLNTSGAFYQAEYTGKELDDWRTWKKKMAGPLDARELSVASLRWYLFAIGRGHMGISTYNEISPEQIEIVKRFKNVFELSYQRFDDLQKAEAQAREAQIEAALERVRSRSMAMQKSDELAAVIQVVYEQLVHLNINTEHAGFVMDYKERDDRLIWVASKYGVPSQLTIPYFDSVYYNSFNEAKEKGLDFFATNLSFGEKNNFYKELFKHVPGISEEDRKFYFSCPGLAISTVLLENIGLYIENFEGIPYSDEDNAILMRFGKVFQQTYTRFLDLQKAEAQAREAQIELAVERVRAKALAMHKSEEIMAVAIMLRSELVALNIPGVAATTIYLRQDNGEVRLWDITSATDTGNGVHFSMDFSFRMEEADPDLWIRKVWDSTENYVIIEQDKQDLLRAIEWTRKYNSETADMTQQFLDANNIVHSWHPVVKLANGKLATDFIQPPPAEMEFILSKMGTAFDLAYKRFLDLQKAEAQTRESQIQLALERARAHSMMMQHSTELDDALRVFHEQVLLLNIPSAFSFLWLPDEDKDRHIFWASWGESNNDSTVFKSKAINYPLDRNEPATAQCLVDWKGNEPVVSYHVPPDGVKNYFAAWSELIAGVDELKPGNFRDGLYYVEAFMKYGCFGVIVRNEMTEDEKKILLRFSIEFERTYTRFLDLQKAEAQAKEAQIEAGLERVRSRAMAMQSSEELNALIGSVFTELTKLDVALTRCAILIFEDRDNEKGSRQWMINAETPSQPMSLYMKYSELPYFKAIRKGWNDRILKWQYVLEGKDKFVSDEFLFKETDLGLLPDFVIDAMRKPDKVYISASFNNFGCIILASIEPLSNEHFDILLRFAKVFDLTYTRFNDLKQAEAQAREAQIETALERVRSRSLAMHKSDEIKDVVKTALEKIQELNIEMNGGVSLVTFSPGSKDLTHWLWIPEQLDDVFKAHLPYFDHIMFRDCDGAREQGVELIAKVYSGKDKETYFDHLFHHTDFSAGPESVKDWVVQQPYFGFSYAIQKHSGIFLNDYTGKFFSKETNDILVRFSKVFEQAYVRFLDLQKAEAQAREAQIEAALERVRSRTNAMHHSNHLHDVIHEVYAQLRQLEFRFDTADFMTDYTPAGFNIWLASGDKSIPSTIYVPAIKHRIFQLLKDTISRKDSFFTFQMTHEEKNDYFKNVFENTAAKHIPEDQKQLVYDAEGMATSCVVLKNVILSVTNFASIPYTDAENDIVRRFAYVFEQSYTRFLDLQKAEAQAREAQIEASLERVRSKAMAMQKSEDLADAVCIVFEELDKLNLDMLRCGIGIVNKEKRCARVWTTTVSDNNTVAQVSGDESMDIHPLLVGTFEAWLKQEDFNYVLKGEDLRNYYKALVEVDFRLPDSQSFVAGEDERVQYFYSAIFPSGGLFVFSESELRQEAKTILRRFADVFNLTYTRFLDIQNAEAQAREAKIETALERVRSRALAMQEPEELKEVAQVMRSEMGALGVEELETSSIYIHGDSSENVECWYALQDPKHTEKKMVADHFILDLAATWVGREMKKFYLSNEKQTSIVMKGINRREWIEYCYTHSPVFTNFYGETIPDRTYHLYRFSHGYIGAAAPGDISAESWRLLSRAASVFSLAYSRFRDLTQARTDLIKLKEEKQRAETALTELQATQKQLVQSEKMASLGELTAGIAHEIQNPLNFVNNFSEVSKELLDEMKTELDSGNIEDAKEIMGDVIQNLEKINHHGKRADGIVKGMLQHSRTSSGQKELTNINTLADEYLRLAYHGLRAKDKSFNAKFETDLDPSIDKISVVPQDIGRVILNLINNAFYAVTERRKKNEPGYEPTVKVTSKKANGDIELRVIDNGTGIPQKALDKIFQPFFTTKPTGQGTGLGLSLSYDIITKGHGGELKVETKEGEGSTFIIQLPIN